MIRACNTGGAYNIFRDIDRDFAVHYFVHGSDRVILRLSSKECQFKSFRRFVTIPDSRT